MENDKKNKDVYPKLSENDKRWKQQDEFDSAGAQRQLEDEDANSTIPESTNNPANGDEKTDEAYSGKAGENQRRDREQP
jgi:hypothetical protein